MTKPEHPNDSLVAALAKAKIPAENHEFIRRIATAVGIAEYRSVPTTDKPYVIAKRRTGMPDLHIYFGYTTGFTSEEEVIRSAGNDADRGPSPGKQTWYVVHPSNRVRQGDARARNIRREAGFCECGMQLSLTGVCSNCD